MTLHPIRVDSLVFSKLVFPTEKLKVLIKLFQKFMGRGQRPRGILKGKAL
jgi:hypothetical protein